MDDNKQPTREQIEANLAKNLSELDQPEETTPEETTPEPEENTPVEETTPTEETPVEEAPVEVQTEEELPEPETPEQEAIIEAEKKEQTEEERRAESTREAQRLYQKNKAINDAIKEANLLPEPTEEELSTEYPQWDMLSDFEKKAATEMFVSKRFRDHINAVSEEQRNVDEWMDKVNKFVEDPRTLVNYPELEGKTEGFKKYVNDRKFAGTDYSLLIKSYLFDEEKNRTPKKGKMFETGQGGDKRPKKPVSDKISVEDSIKIRETDSKKYKELLLAGKIATTIE